MDIDQAGGALSWRAAVDVAQELGRDTGSHLFASQQGWKWVASHTDIGIATITNALTGKASIPSPIPDEHEVEPSVRAEVEEYYAAHSAWN